MLPPSTELPRTVDAQRRITALQAAISLRDCSFAEPPGSRERRSCRMLMREAAIAWQQGTRATRSK